jgi:valyl-tRNA synthetase
MPHVTEEIWSQFHESRLMVSPWPDAFARDPAAAELLERVRDAAAVFRRSGVAPVNLGEDEQRIFVAVVKPERQKANGDATAERERLRKEIERAERMLGDERFLAKAPPDVVEGERAKLERYRRELETIGD